ncbi:MAG: DUF1934 domain-containing protein [Ruminococcaceae bacterium]|nr:DUF1934 domain-containing protein [Oscillospiraceae bacterium]
MNENYLINIEGTMEQEGDMDTVRLMTRGSFVQHEGRFFISYRETEATGYEGNTTTVTVEDAHKVSMTRTGNAPSELVIERGKRHVCHYDHGYGVLSLGVAADEIENGLGAHGGNLSFSYTLDSGNAHLSHNQVKITVQEAT